MREKIQALRRAGNHAANRLCKGEREQRQRRDPRRKSGRAHRKCLDYDFSLADKDTAMRSGVIARTIVLDKLTKSWLAAHSGAVVVNIACGLDTRCYRMSGYAHWYNLDLPETMAVRESFCRKAARFRRLPCPPWKIRAAKSASRMCRC